MFQLITVFVYCTGVRLEMFVDSISEWSGRVSYILGCTVFMVAGGEVDYIL